MSTITAGNPGFQDPKSQNPTEAAHCAAKALYLNELAERLEGDDAAYVAKLAEDKACASAFLAEHMEAWPI